MWDNINSSTLENVDVPMLRNIYSPIPKNANIPILENNHISQIQFQKVNIDILRNSNFWVFVLVDSLLILYGCVFENFFFFFAYLCSQLEIVGPSIKQSEDRLL